MSFHQNLLQFVAIQSFQKPQWRSVESVEGIKDLDMKQSTFAPPAEGLKEVVNNAWQLKINGPKPEKTAWNEKGKSSDYQAPSIFGGSKC